MAAQADRRVRRGALPAVSSCAEEASSSISSQRIGSIASYTRGSVARLTSFAWAFAKHAGIAGKSIRSCARGARSGCIIQAVCAWSGALNTGSDSIQAIASAARSTG